jgi:GMP synthase (glutamine-hydrolysing)
MQTMAHQLGGKVESGQQREFGFAAVRARGHTALLKDIADRTTAEGHGMLDVWMSHGDKVTELPPGFKLMASTDSCPIAGMADEARRFYAVQFHPEVTHTVQGHRILERFVRDICQAAPGWVMKDHIEDAVQKIRAQVGDEEVILGLSGGVDSSVAAALIHRAIGDQLTCVFVDHGLLRLNEGDMVMEMFAGKLHAKVIRVDASDLFLGKLAGVSEPEAKRKIIGGLFVDVFKAEAAKLKAGGGGHKGASFLGQEQKGRDDQEPPQRGRPTRATGPEASGAAARSVQGRSARTRRGPGPALRHGLSPSLPGPGPGRAHSG